MARYKCPGCGQPYNGKRCGSCFYENFSDEISCAAHHKEVVFDDGKTVGTAPKVQPRQSTPRQTAPRPYANTRTKKKQRAKPGKTLRILLIVYGIALLINAAYGAVGDVWDVTTGGTILPEPEPEIAMPVGGTVLYEAEDLLIKTDWEEGTAYADDISIFVRNETHRDLTVSAREITVNGYLVDTSYLYCAAGEDTTAIGYLRLDENALADAGIETVAEISFYLDIFDSDSYESVAETDPITLTAAVPEGFAQPVDDSGTLLWEQDGIKVVCKGYRPDSYDPDDVQEGTIQFFIENNTDRYLSFYTPVVTVNEEEAYLNLWCQLRPGTRTVADMYLYSLEDVGIDSIEEIDVIAFTLEISDADDWEYTIQTDTLYVDITE